MIKRILLSFPFCVLLLGGVFFVVQAQTQNQILTQEAIVSFVSDIRVNNDNSIDVQETITYNTGPLERHGIYRDIYPYSSEGKKVGIENVTVADEAGNFYSFQLLTSGSYFRIKIGDPNVTFSGSKTYIIKYHVTRAVAQLKDLDEIYWNVTGNNWEMPIYNIWASVVLPAGAKSMQSACYYGPKGSTNQCQISDSSDGSYIFQSPSMLNPGEGMTVAVGFPKGNAVPYSTSDSVANFFDIYWPWFVAAILPLLTLILSLSHWYKKGRDARGSGVIIPQYDVPDDLTPMEVGGIANEKVAAAQISAEIIYLATKGYLKINQLEERFIGLIKRTDYELIKLKDFTDLPNEFDQKLLRGLFEPEPRLTLRSLRDMMGPKVPQAARSIFNFLIKIQQPSSAANKAITGDSKRESVKLSDLKYVFYTTASAVVASVLDALLSKGYYKNLGRMNSGRNGIFLTIFMSVWASVFLGTILGGFLLKGNVLPMIVGIFLSTIIYGIISYFSPAKTEKGVVAKEYILGLKDYLQIAEKDRLKFHNAPEKRPEVFEKLLPYAMVLGVANIWAKEFEGIYTAPPSWYSGSAGTAFSAIAFSHSMSNFSSFATSSLSSTPGGGGSGGGGSSGGGGGGGGGGGW